MRSTRWAKRADLAIWNLRQPAEFSYWIGGSMLRFSVIGGSVRVG